MLEKGKTFSIVCLVLLTLIVIIGQQVQINKLKTNLLRGQCVFSLLG